MRSESCCDMSVFFGGILNINSIYTVLAAFYYVFMLRFYIRLLIFFIAVHLLSMNREIRVSVILNL